MPVLKLERRLVILSAILTLIIIAGIIICIIKYNPQQPVEIMIPQEQLLTGTIYIDGVVKQPRSVPYSGKVSHHGSIDATTAGFLNTVNPSVAIISVGENNRYGHPSHGPFVTAGDTAVILRTDLQGSLRLAWDRAGRLESRPMTPLPGRIGLP